MTERPVTTEQTQRAQTDTVLLLAVAVLAVSSAAILVRWADASALSLSFWRTAGGAVILLLLAGRRALASVGREHVVVLVVAGGCLAAHFWLWLASLERTSVAASTTLVSTVPLFVAGFQFALTRIRPSSLTVLAIGLAVLGSAIIAGGDFGLNGDELLGDGLALGGAATMAGYLLAGERLRVDLTNAAYSGVTYAIAAGTLAVASVVTRTTLSGFDVQTWGVIAALIIGPQLLGHTVLNDLLAKLGSLPVSMALLLEPVGAGLLAWLLLAEPPTTAVWLGAPLVIGAVALQLRTQLVPGTA